MNRNDIGQSAIKERDEFAVKHPTFRESYDKFLRDYKKYISSFGSKPFHRHPKSIPTGRFLK